MLFFPTNRFVVFLFFYQSLLFFDQFGPFLACKYKSFVVFAAEEKFNDY